MGQSQKNFFAPSGPAQFGLKIRGDLGPPGPSPGSATALLDVIPGFKFYSTMVRVGGGWNPSPGVSDMLQYFEAILPLVESH